MRIKLLALSLLFVCFAHIDFAYSKQFSDCVSCHTEAVSKWQKSDHAKAMSLADKKNVLGDFKNIKVEHYSQKARFFETDDGFFIEMNEAGKVNEYKVDFTFGHYPLQQYLVETEPGTYQVFPFVWDSRDKKEGGQRWYPIYENEDIKKNDRLHWKQPLQNWNGMCADCHSSNLKRNYSTKQNRFKTTYDEINVGCKSCHMISSNHDEVKTNKKRQVISEGTLKDIGMWLREKDQKTASWQGPARNNDFMGSCFACHSLRSPVTDGFRTDVAFLDQFNPTLLSQPLYYADGQIKEEVYVYGSFLQSKMYAAGVNCLDCHDAHSAQVKTQTNSLCLQCHSPQEYQTSSHTGHELTSVGSKCINCHMPETTYMGVDNRRDHSFKVPRPHLSIQFKTPHACQQCHEDKSDKWAIKSIENIHGKAQKLPKGEQLFMRLMAQSYLPLSEHIKVINDKSLNEIKRASAIMLLPNSTKELPLQFAQTLANSAESLIRLAFAQIAYILPPSQLSFILSPLLKDEYRAIRVAAANQLVGYNIDTSSFREAFEELLTVNEINSWRGEGNLNQSLVHARMQKWEDAENALLTGIKIDPYFAPNYINLSNYYKNTGETQKESNILQVGIEANPKASLLRYSFAMFQVRNQKKEEALKSIRSAVNLELYNPQYAYIFILLIDDVQNTQKAISELKRIVSRYENRRQLVQLGLKLSHKIKDYQSVQFFQRMI